MSSKVVKGVKSAGVNAKSKQNLCNNIVKNSVELFEKFIAENLDAAELKTMKKKLATFSKTFAESTAKLFPSKKERRDPNRPKKPLSGFFRFKKEFISDIKSNNPHLKGRQLNSVITKAYNDFKNNKDNEKKLLQYEQEYKTDKKKYEKTINEYNIKNGIHVKDKKEQKPKSKNSINMFRAHFIESKLGNSFAANVAWSKMKENKENKDVDDMESCAYWKQKAHEYNVEHGFVKKKSDSSEEVDEEEKEEKRAPASEDSD
jgi:high mobility group protein B1